MSVITQEPAFPSWQAAAVPSPRMYTEATYKQSPKKPLQILIQGGEEDRLGA